ncbi:hypothetical protein [Eudoraea adriatica]|uniref:hypothetical protein n=1 Tax=Eudoraea adriatica TaxID=446681 RepID=UPI0003740EAE|nr:hypothetical protein [Eudoraea adriatica]
MKFYKILGVFHLLVISSLFISCTNDDNRPEMVSEEQMPDYIVIGQNFQSVFQYNYDGSQDEGELFNLTQESNINREYLTLRQVSQVLTFFSFAAGSFSAVQRNHVTGESTFLNEFYTISNERSVIWGASSENKLFLGFFNPEASTNYGIRTIDLTTEQETDLIIEYNVNDVFEPIYYDGRLLVTYLDQEANYKLAVLDTESNLIIRTFDFGKLVPSILINKDGEMYIFSGNSASDYELTLYDLQTLNVIQQDLFSINRYFLAGPIQSVASIYNEKLYYLNLYAQPSLIPFGPATYDFITKENVIIDMPSIVQQVQDELGLDIELTAFAYNEKSKTFLMGYAKFVNVETLEGGVLIISEKGRLLKNTNLKFAPTRFIDN